MPREDDETILRSVGKHPALAMPYGRSPSLMALPLVRRSAAMKRYQLLVMYGMYPPRALVRETCIDYREL